MCIDFVKADFETSLEALLLCPRASDIGYLAMVVHGGLLDIVTNRDLLGAASELLACDTA